MSDFVALLRHLGVRYGDHVMLHVSLRTVKWPGGAEGLFRDLRAVIGDCGTLFMLVGSPAGTIEFDSTLTPTNPVWGATGKALLQQPGVKRTKHPTHSFAALGGKADELCSRHGYTESHGLDSALGHFAAVGGKVLLLGVDWNTVTGIHLVESIAGLKNRRRLKFEAVVDGESVEIERWNSEDYVPGFDPPDYFTSLMEDFCTTGRVTRLPWTQGQFCAFDLHDLVDFGVPWLESRQN